MTALRRNMMFAKRSLFYLQHQKGAAINLVPWIIQNFFGRACCSLFHNSPVFSRTVNQIIRQGPVKRSPAKKSPISGRPQMKGVVLQVLTLKPKKPNSAQRKCCRVRLSNGKELIAYIPGEGHTLQEHNIVLVEGGRTQDLPGVRVKVIRGKYDCAHPVKK